jgi:hypothetical protein
VPACLRAGGSQLTGALADVGIGVGLPGGGDVEPPLLVVRPGVVRDVPLVGVVPPVVVGVSVLLEGAVVEGAVVVGVVVFVPVVAGAAGPCTPVLLTVVPVPVTSGRTVR